MNYSFEINDNSRELTITFKNLNLEVLNQLAQEENIEHILNEKYYNQGMYDKIELLGSAFMVLKSTKKQVVMLMIT